MTSLITAVVDQLTESASSALNKWGDEITDAFSNVGNYIYDAFNFVVVPINQTIVIPAVAPVDAVWVSNLCHKYYR